MFRCEQCGAFNRVPAERPAGEAVCGKCKAVLALTGAPQEVDTAAYRRAIANSPIPVLVDFWAPWCGPCRVAGPIIDKLGRARPGQVLVLKLNTDEHSEPPSELGIQGIPTFIVFQDGVERARQAGLMPFETFDSWLTQNTATARA